MHTKLEFSPTAEDNDDLLVNDYDYNGPDELEREIINALLRYTETIGKAAVIINSTDRGVEDLLHALDFDIVEEYQEKGLTTGVYEFDSHSNSNTKRLVTEEHTISELIELWQNDDIGLDEANSIVDHNDNGLELKFTGSDGQLIVNYSLDEELSYRSDVENNTTQRFNIFA